LIDRIPEPRATVVPPPADRQLGDQPWIVVDRASHTLTLLRNGEPIFATYVSLGKAGKDTPDGTYFTYLNYTADRMTSTSVPDAERSYNLPNVPFAQYFKDDGSAVHGTYWHDNFGGDDSQGCINVTWSDGAYLFQQTNPSLGEGELRAQAPPEEATPLIIVR
jgi:lipoprotein-anchoring transpeptidase ErfK/SrfK